MLRAPGPLNLPRVQGQPKDSIHLAIHFSLSKSYEVQILPIYKIRPDKFKEQKRYTFIRKFIVKLGTCAWCSFIHFQ